MLILEPNDVITCDTCNYIVLQCIARPNPRSQGYASCFKYLGLTLSQAKTNHGRCPNCNTGFWSRLKYSGVYVHVDQKGYVC